ESVRVVERPRTADPTDPSPPRGPCPRARPDLHARLLPHLASESRVETPVVHRRAPTRQPRSRRESRPLSRRSAESPDQTRQHRPPRPRLPHPPRRARDPAPEHPPPARPHQPLRETHPADAQDGFGGRLATAADAPGDT